MNPGSRRVALRRSVVLEVRRVPSATFGRAERPAGWECRQTAGPGKTRGVAEWGETRDAAVRAFVRRLKDHGYTGRYRLVER